MPTKTSPSRRSGSRGARKRPSKPASKKKKTSVRTVLSPWARDALGIGLIVLSLLGALSIWMEAGGPFGDAIAWLLLAAFGIGAYAFPFVGALWGLILFRDTAREDRVRMFIGFAALVLGILGLISLYKGNPAFGEGFGGSHDVEGFAEAGGVVGVIAAWPLSRLISPIGAAIVCGGLSALGLLIFTGTPFSAIRDKVAEFREERDERDPVAAKARDEAEELSRPLLQWFREAFGLFDDDTDDRVFVPEADETTQTIEFGDDSEEEFEEEPAASEAAKRPRSRTITTPQGPYHLPPLDLLRSAPPSNADARAERDTLAALERTLHTFGVDARVVAAHRGPTVTMYEVAVASGTKVNKVLSL